MTTTVKTCFRCGVLKPLIDFYAHKQMADGRLNKCKACNKLDVSENYRARRDQYAAYERERNQQPQRKQARSEYHKKRDPVKKRATMLTSNAIRDGRLIRKPCEVCAETKVEAHHDNYSKPLDVRWLCRPHHLEHHGKVSIEKNMHGLSPRKTPNGVSQTQGVQERPCL